MAAADARMDDAAGFLRRLAVADAKVLLDRTRKEKESKTLEMQKMIGVRYRDLIESADKIVNMHSAALRLEVSLKEMPEQWRSVEKTLTAALAPTADVVTAIQLEESSPNEDNESDEAPCETVEECVAFLVKTPENLWRALDRGDTFQAYLLLQKATAVYEQLDLDSAEQLFPFLRALWSSIDSFNVRVTSLARSYLACRGRESKFYAENLGTLVVTEPSLSDPSALLECFLSSRSKWMDTGDIQDEEEDTSRATITRSQQRILTTILKTICMTMSHLADIFAPEHGDTMLTSVLNDVPGFKDGLDKFVSSGAFTSALTKWFRAELSKIHATATPIVSKINSTLQLSKLQTHLRGINKKFNGCKEVNVWRTISKSEFSRSNEPSSVFSVLFADIFRRQTRELVQSSFVDALEAIQKQVRSVIGTPSATNNRGDFQLSGITFYDFFEQIHENTSALDASDLQSVLIEEFMRTVLQFINFLEHNFPLSDEVHQDPVGRATGYLAISNMLAGILSGFSCRRDKLFPGVNAQPGLKTITQNAFNEIIQKHTKNGFVDSAAIPLLFQDMGLTKRTSALSFVDEEVKSISTLGVHSCYLVCQIQVGASYPELFERALQNLSAAYCEVWAQILLGQKVQPLRELLEMENYAATNEDWIAAHEGWSEHVITDEVLGAEDTDDSSDTEIRLGEEKVWLPWCETPVVSSFLFSCCYGLDEANRIVRRSLGSDELQIALMHATIRNVLVEQLTLITTKVYSDAVSQLVDAKAKSDSTILNFGECCVLQFLFDMYFVRATLGFSDFIRFGWGDELDPEECSPGLLQLKKLFARMQEFIDPVDWEIYGPQLVENVVMQFRKSRLLFSSLSESNDINQINGKEIVISSQDTRPLARVMEPVARFSLLPVPSSRRKFHRSTSTLSKSSEDEPVEPRSRANSRNLFHELSEDGDGESQQPAALRFQNLLSGSAGTNLLQAASSGTTLLSSAAKGIGFLSSATSSYLREGENRSSRYF